MNPLNMRTHNRWDSCSPLLELLQVHGLLQGGRDHPILSVVQQARAWGRDSAQKQKKNAGGCLFYPTLVH